MKFKKLLIIGALVALAAPLAACSTGATSTDSAKGTVNWWTWDANQASAYATCIPGFEKANPGIKVKITQYPYADYFTKLPIAMTAGTAPDAFQDSGGYFGSLAAAHQLEPLGSYIKSSNFSMNTFNVGVDAWKYTDGKQYGLPLDWAAAQLYYNEDDIKAAGYTDADIQNMTWNPTNGGTFGKIVAHLTVDKNGIRGDEPGFDKNNVKTYGTNQLASDDNIGQTSWSGFASTLGWRLGNTAAWPTEFEYKQPAFVQTMTYLQGLADKGYAPKMGQFTNGEVDEMGSGSVAIVSSGSWNIAGFSDLPGVKVGVAPTVKGPKGTRATMSNSNGNNIWAGSKKKAAAWKWISYMATVGCMTTAAEKNASFLPPNSAAMAALVQNQAAKGVNLSVLASMQKNKEVYTLTPFLAANDLQTALTPIFDSYVTGKASSPAVFNLLSSTSKQILTAAK